MSKTAHYVTLYKYRINDVIKCTWGIPYKRVDAAAVVAAHLIVLRACVSTADMTLAPDADVLRGRFAEERATGKTATENWATGKLGNRKKTAIGKEGNGKLGNRKKTATEN